MYLECGMVGTFEGVPVVAWDLDRVVHEYNVLSLEADVRCFISGFDCSFHEDLVGVISYRFHGKGKIYKAETSSWFVFFLESKRISVIPFLECYKHFTRSF
jgi:hypothetical protein